MRNIAHNRAKMTALMGKELDLLKKEREAPKRKPRARKRRRPALPQRRSSRQRHQPPAVYTPSNAEEEAAAALAAREAEVARGHRREDGRWRGECFGAVRGVPVGTVFGAGDYQRLGRKEMASSGFFVPFVTPEWIQPRGACYALILNNDNGLSRDQGDVVHYAGSGGRRRGQNRTAPQSFDQSWSSVTNAALRLNHTSGKLVRVIRGPKLRSALSTAHSGGGFRYDGLFSVSKAEMVPTGPAGLLTAMFTLERAAGDRAATPA